MDVQIYVLDYYRQHYNHQHNTLINFLTLDALTILKENGQIRLYYLCNIAPLSKALVLEDLTN